MDDVIRQSVILVIDDDPASAARCQALIDALCATPLTVTSRQAAEEILSEITPDVAIVSAELPDASGIEAIKLFRQCAELRGTPVILLNDDLPRRELEHAAMAGMYAALARPVDVDEFLGLIRTALADGRRVKRRPAPTRRL
jgi:DNA-binding response OmpR family regulator